MNFVLISNKNIVIFTLIECSNSKQYGITLGDGTRATIDFAVSFLVINSGLELHADINGTKLSSFEFESMLPAPEGYSRLISNNSGCSLDGISSRCIALLANSSSA